MPGFRVPTLASLVGNMGQLLEHEYARFSFNSGVVEDQDVDAARQEETVVFKHPEDLESRTAVTRTSIIDEVRAPFIIDRVGNLMLFRIKEPRMG